MEIMGIMTGMIGLVVAGIIILSLFSFLASRYKRCPSDKILVNYGRVGAGASSNCIHGGGAFVWPLVQDSAYMSLTPMTINIPLENALSKQNIRVSVPSTFTVGISTEEGVMNNAAERLLGQHNDEIIKLVREIIFGQLRQTVATLTIEQINGERDKFLDAIRNNVEPELNKIGLYLINVNITDITDESDYIANIGKKAAAEANNQAKIDVAEQQKLGAIGEASAVKEREIQVAQHLAESEKGKKEAEADQRVFIQQQEATAVMGESSAQRVREIKVAENDAETEKGKKKAEAEKRIFIQQQEAEAIKGEALSQADIAAARASLAVKQAESLRQGEVAKRNAEVEIQKAQYMAEQQRLNAQEIVRQEAEKLKVEIAAEAQAQKTRREAQGQADAILSKYEAEAKGIRQVLESKAEGYSSLVKSCNGDTKAAATLLMIEKIEEIVATQVEAIKNLKIDKITVWDSGNGNGDGSSSTSNFVSSLIKTLPPLHEVAEMAGVSLPAYLGQIDGPLHTPDRPTAQVSVKPEQPGK